MSTGRSENTLENARIYYELSNHLGNVLVTISDRKLQHDEASGGKVDYYLPDVLTVSDYDPFGNALQERTGQQADAKYRYGMNGQEKDNEVYGNGNSYTAESWNYDPRLGRRWNVDPLMNKFPWQSPYSAFDNRPINTADPTGRGGEVKVTKDKESGEYKAEVKVNVYIYSDEISDEQLEEFRGVAEIQLNNKFNHPMGEDGKPLKTAQVRAINPETGQAELMDATFNIEVHTLLSGGSETNKNLILNASKQSNNYFYVFNGEKGSQMGGAHGGNTGILNLNATVNSWSHEILHMLGYILNEPYAKTEWGGHNDADDYSNMSPWAKYPIKQSDLLNINGAQPLKPGMFGIVMGNFVYNQRSIEESKAGSGKNWPPTPAYVPMKYNGVVNVFDILNGVKK